MIDDNFVDKRMGLIINKESVCKSKKMSRTSGRFKKQKHKHKQKLVIGCWSHLRRASGTSLQYPFALFSTTPACGHPFY